MNKLSFSPLVLLVKWIWMVAHMAHRQKTSEQYLWLLFLEENCCDFLKIKRAAMVLLLLFWPIRVFPLFV